MPCYPNDIDSFFHHEKRGVRATLFKHHMTQRQVEGCIRVIEMCRDDFKLPLEQCAYILATSYHETVMRMHPVREALGRTDGETKRRLESAFRAGKLRYVKTPYWREGWYGRGEIQLTHKYNYVRMNKFVKPDIVENPDKVIEDPRLSTFIMIKGMVDGLFTKHKLADFYIEGSFDSYGARRIVNPHDINSFRIIQEVYNQFYSALLAP